MVLSRGVRRLRTSFTLSRGAACAFELVITVVVVVLAKGCKAHGHELDEEEDEDHDQRDAFGPRVVGNGARETFVTKSFVGGGEEVDEGGGYDDAGAEVLHDEECPSGDTDGMVTGSIDGKEGACSIIS